MTAATRRLAPTRPWPMARVVSILITMRRFSPSGLIVLIAACAAMVLTVTRPSPEGIISFGLGEREVRAAPGQTAAAASKHNLTALDVFNVTLVRVRDAYVDPTRIDPKKMLYSALDSVQFNIPEVLIEALPERDEVVVVVNDRKQRFSTREVDSPWRLSSKLKKIFRFIEAHMNRGADLAQVEYAAVNGMLGTLDPHSVLLDPETAREMDVSTSGKFGGLGIVIRMIKRKLMIIRPMKGTPAARAGLKRGDHIDLDPYIFGQAGHLDRGACGRRALEPLAVDLVDRGKVVHVTEKDRGLDNIGKAGAGRLQDVAEIVQDLARLRGHVARADDLHGGRVEGDLA